MRSRLHPVQRRPARLPRRLLRHAGGDADPRLSRPAFPLRAGGGPHAEADRAADAPVGERHPPQGVSPRRRSPQRAPLSAERGAAAAGRHARSTRRRLEALGRSAYWRSAKPRTFAATSSASASSARVRDRGVAGSIGDAACARSAPSTASAMPASVKKLPLTCARRSTTRRKARKSSWSGRGFSCPEAVERALEGQARHVEERRGRAPSAGGCDAAPTARSCCSRRRRPGSCESSVGRCPPSITNTRPRSPSRSAIRFACRRKFTRPLSSGCSLTTSTELARRLAREGFHHHFHHVRHRLEGANGGGSGSRSRAAAAAGRRAAPARVR